MHPTPQPSVFRVAGWAVCAKFFVYSQLAHLLLLDDVIDDGIGLLERLESFGEDGILRRKEKKRPEATHVSAMEKILPEKTSASHPGMLFTTPEKARATTQRSFFFGGATNTKLS